MCWGSGPVGHQLRGFYGLIPHKATNNLSVYPQPTLLPPLSTKPGPTKRLQRYQNVEERQGSKGGSCVWALPGLRHRATHLRLAAFHPSYRKWTHGFPFKRRTCICVLIRTDKKALTQMFCGIKKRSLLVKERQCWRSKIKTFLLMFKSYCSHLWKWKSHVSVIYI